ncbi:MAG: response regulator [Pseudomonadota bacterium]
MSVLIVESDPHLGAVWKRHLERQGNHVALAETQQTAIEAMLAKDVALILLNVELRDGSALAVADFASYRYPSIKVVFVTAKKFFSDGSIFSLAPNACAYVAAGTPVDDLAAMVEHYAARD